MQIRPATENDAEVIQAIYAPVVASTAISFEVEPPSVAEMARRVREISEQYPFLIADDGSGYAYASQHRTRAAYRFSVDVSVYVAAHARGRGVGRALYTKLFEHLAALGYCAAYAGIALPNPASVALHEALGFEPVGVYRAVGFKLGAWHDVAWFQRTLRPRENNPREPTPWKDHHGRNND